MDAPDLTPEQWVDEFCDKFGIDKSRPYYEGLYLDFRAKLKETLAAHHNAVVEACSPYMRHKLSCYTEWMGEDEHLTCACGYSQAILALRVKEN